MADNLRVSHSEMERYAKDFETAGNEFENLIGTMGKLTAGLRDTWEGAAAQSYEQRFHELQPSFNATRSLIAEISSALYKSSARMKETDDAIAQGFMG